VGAGGPAGRHGSAGAIQSGGTARAARRLRAGSAAGAGRPDPAGGRYVWRVCVPQAQQKVSRISSSRNPSQKPRFFCSIRYATNEPPITSLRRPFRPLPLNLGGDAMPGSAEHSRLGRRVAAGKVVGKPISFFDHEMIETRAETEAVLGI
jgi:hypothetical protein